MGMHVTIVRARYARRVPLLACPFCREMFPDGERKTCPVCGVPLVAQGKLPLSDDALSEDGLARQPEWDLLPFTYLRRGRGPLALLCVLGLVAFFMPWVLATAMAQQVARFANSAGLRAFGAGAAPAVVGILGVTALSLSDDVLVAWPYTIIGVAAFVIHIMTRVHPVALLTAGGLAAWLVN